MSSEIEFKVLDHPNLVRRRGAIVNKDLDGFQRFLSARQAISDKDRRLATLEDQLARLTALVEQKLGGA